MKDPWNKTDDLTDGWASGTAPSNTWTAGGSLSDGWADIDEPYTESISGDDDFYILGDDDEYIDED